MYRHRQISRVCLQDSSAPMDRRWPRDNLWAILRVGVEDGGGTGRVVEVPVCPDTLCQDVLDCVSSPPDSQPHLLEVRGISETEVHPQENLYSRMLGYKGEEGVQYVLRFGPLGAPLSWVPRSPLFDPIDNDNVDAEGRRVQMRRGLPGDPSHPRVSELPGGGDLSIAELQALAARQQQQLENQQQALVAKEQRLKFLKQQEAGRAAMVAEQDEMRRRKIKAQEMKLKQLRALRSQVEQQKTVTSDLTSELDSVKTVFNEKEKELALAVAKVEQLTRQLESIRQAKLLNGNIHSATAQELEKVRKELMLQKQLNEKRSLNINAHLKDQKDKLKARHEDMTRINSYISEMQQQVKKRQMQKALANKAAAAGQQPANLNDAHHRTSGPGDVTLERYSQHPSKDGVPSSKDDMFSAAGFNKQDPKYQSLPNKAQFVTGEKGRGDESLSELNNNTLLKTVQGNSAPGLKPPPGTKSMPSKDDLFSNTGFNKQDPKYQSLPNKAQFVTGEKGRGDEALEKLNNNNTQKTSLDNSISVAHPPATKPMPNGSVQQGMPATSLAPGQPGWVKAAAAQRSGGAVSSISNMAPRPFGTTYATSGNRGPSAVQTPVISISEEERQAGSGQSSPASSDSSQASQGRGRPMPPALTPRVSDGGSGQGPGAGGAPVSNKSGNGVVVGPGVGRGGPSHLKPGSSSGAPPPPPPPPPPSVAEGKSGTPGQDSVDSKFDSPKQQDLRSPVATSTPITSGSGGGVMGSNSPPAGTKNAPTIRYAPKSVIASTYMGRGNRVQPPPPHLEPKGGEGSGPSPAGRPGGPEPQGSPVDKHARNLDLAYKGGDGSSGGSGGASGVTGLQQQQDAASAVPSGPGGGGSGSEEKTAFTQGSVDKTDGHPSRTRRLGTHPGVFTSDKGSFKPHTPKNIRRRHSDSDEDLAKFLHRGHQHPGSGEPHHQMASLPEVPPPPGPFTPAPDPLPPARSPPGSGTSPGEAPAVKKKKTNLKGENSVKNSNRVRFDPLALLLDASLEGELDLVMRYAREVQNVSASNDEGITALHNAICAGHFEIVKFLVEFGCDINSPDSDGWTPLHCAASCNNILMVKFLVEHGACIFATTFSDEETAADKWEEDDSSYDGCSDYLYSVQEKLGIMNNGEVYAVFDHQAEREDELSFRIGDKMIVLRKGDESEKEWWWARLGDREGYIPRNYLGMYPRVLPGEREK